MSKTTFNIRWNLCFKNDFDATIRRLIFLIQSGKEMKPILISEESRIKNLERIRRNREAQKLCSI